MLSKLEELRIYLYKKGFKDEAYMLNSLANCAESEENFSEEDTFSIIDLIGNYETGVVLKDKKPQHVISYSEDGEPGNDFTDDEDELSKSAIGLFDVPQGYPDGQYARRDGDEYRQEDKETAEKFFGAESNMESEESSPPANIERCNNKPINILDQTEFEDFFSFLYSTDGKLKRKKTRGYND